MSDTQDKKFFKKPGIDQDLLKKELNLPSKEVSKATYKEQIRFQAFGNKAIDYNKFIEEKEKVSAKKPHSWVRFKSDEDPEPKPEEPGVVRIIKELSPPILISIADSKLPKEKKEDIKHLFEDIKLELHKTNLEWDLVISMLKKTLDYDLKVAALIVHLASACYQLWEHEQKENTDPEKPSVSALFNKIRPKTME